MAKVIYGVRWALATLIRPMRLSVVVVVMAVLIGWMLAEHSFGPASITAFRLFLADAAAAATLLAVLAAGVFAAMSGRQIDEVISAMDVINRRMSPDEAAEDAADGAEDEIAEPDFEQIIPATGDGGQAYQFARLALNRVPLRVWSALVNDWSQDERRRRTGESVAWVVRRTGRGNFPWIISFLDEPDYVYSVVYGGQGKVGPSVKRFERPEFLSQL